MHIFLTGEVGCGKSTAIRRSLQMLGDPRLGGFRTITVPSLELDALGELYIVAPDDAGNLRCRDNLVGIRWGGGKGTGFASGFEVGGCRLLTTPPPDTKLLLMDELGTMERMAPQFCAAVLAALDGDLPVVGVVKPIHAPLLDAVRAHPRVLVISVDQENRDDLPALICRLLHAGGTILG